MKKLGVLACISLMVTVSSLFADPVALLSAAQERQFKEDWYGAIEYYQEALRENSAYNSAYKGLATCFYSIGEYEQALKQIENALYFKKDDPELISLKGFISIGLGDLKSATTLFSQVLKAWPNDTNARFGLAEIEIHNGRIISASDHYREALTRNPENRKALLSLALLSQEAGNSRLAREYLDQALRYHGENPQVFYYAAYLSTQDGRTEEAERHVRRALLLQPDYDSAQELLGVILFRSGRYSEVIPICDARIALNRNRASAWYLKTLSMEKLFAYEDALTAARAGLEVAPDDDVLRSLMELIIIEHLPFEDGRRRIWSSWHVNRAQRFEQKNLADQALYEYRRALKVYPDDAQTRYAYARLLLARGYPERFLSQLEFIQSLGKSTTTINDALESYTRLLANSVQRVWKIDPLYLDKGHTSIGLFYQNEPSNVIHPDSERITMEMLAEAFTYNQRFVISEGKKPVRSYSEAFRISRQRGDDYFALIRYSENDRDVRIIADMYVSSTGTLADSFTVFRTGNDRYPNALRRMTQMLISAFPVRGIIAQRHQSDAVIDLGKTDGVIKDQVFDVVSADSIMVSGEGISLIYDKKAVLGTITITTPDEDISLGKITRSGFYDRINTGDVVVLTPPKDAEQTSDSVENGAKTAPALFKLIRQIR